MSLPDSFCVDIALIYLGYIPKDGINGAYSNSNLYETLQNKIAPTLAAPPPIPHQQSIKVSKHFEQIGEELSAQLQSVAFGPSNTLPTQL